jgi:hypothetical protein
MWGSRNSLVAALVAVSAWVGHSQTHTVNIKGTVLDSRSGVLIPGAKVTLAGNASITATTDAQGAFTLSGQVTGLSPVLGAAQAMTLSSGSLRFQVDGSTAVRVEAFDLAGNKVKTLAEGTLASGAYTLSSPLAGLPAGLYVVRGQVGAKASSFRLPSMGLVGSARLLPGSAASARLAKQAADVVDTLKVVRDGYVSVIKPIQSFTGLHQIDLSPKLGAGDLKIVSERGMPQVNWGLNVDVQVWDGSGATGTQLRGNFPTAFEGKESWLVKFPAGLAFSAWGFVANNYPEDMSAWANGAMHIAVKGTVPSLGVTMSSPDQTNGSSVKVDVTKYGYKPDNQWYEMNIPLSEFTGTDFSRVSTYLGLVTPVDGDTIPFNTDNFYQIDDVYWKVTK